MKSTNPRLRYYLAVLLFVLWVVAGWGLFKLMLNTPLTIDEDEKPFEIIPSSDD